MVDNKNIRYINYPKVTKLNCEFSISAYELSQILLTQEFISQEEKVYNGGFFEYLAMVFCKDKDVVWGKF